MKYSFLKIVFVGGLLAMFGHKIIAGPQANKFDPQSSASVFGKDIYPALYDQESRGTWNFAFDLTPYYQDASSGRSWAGDDTTFKDPTSSSSGQIDVGIMEERGSWNMLGIFYGVADKVFSPTAAIPPVEPSTDRYTVDGPIDFLPSGFKFKDLATGKEVETVGVPEISVYNGGAKISALVGGAGNWTAAKYKNYVDTLYLIAFENQTNGTHFFNGSPPVTSGGDNLAYRLSGTNATNSSSPAVSSLFKQVLMPNDIAFDELNYENQKVGFYHPQLKFKRQGLRLKVSATFFPGVKFWARGGVCEYKMQAMPFSQNDIKVRSMVTPTRSLKPQKSTEADDNDPDSRSANPEDLNDLANRVAELTPEGNAARKKSRTSKKTAVPTEEVLDSALETVEALDTTTRTIASQDQDNLERYFLNSTAMRQVLTDLGINIENYREWTFEDTYLAADFAYPFLFRSPDGQDVVKLWPIISVGVWVPTGREPKNTGTSYVFRVPMGNDHHVGFSVDGALNFDFKNSITFNVGIGGTFFRKKVFDHFPIKIHPKQRGILPWHAQVERKLGDTLTAHAGMAANNFLDGLSAYVEYCYTTHRADELAVLDGVLKALQDSDQDMHAAFVDQAKETAWNTQELHVGLSYQVTQNLELGAAVKAHVKGDAVPKVKTIMTSMKIAF